jgi:uncharacterized phage-associated protein
MLYDARKLDDLVLYIASECEPSRLTKTQLHKTLWYADANAFLASGSPITGETYRKDKFGPVAAHLDDALKRLGASGKLKVGRDVAAESKWEFIAKARPGLAWITPLQREALDDALQFVCYENTAASISRATHDRIWEIASKGEAMPIETALVAELAPLDDEDVAWAREALSASK